MTTMRKAVSSICTQTCTHGRQAGWRARRCVHAGAGQGGQQSCGLLSRWGCRATGWQEVGRLMLSMPGLLHLCAVGFQP